MRRLHLSPKKPFGPLTFLAQLESNMRAAGCSKSAIAMFKTLFANPDPQSLYAQNILADLQANDYAPESVERHITRMANFRKKCYLNLNIQGCTDKDLTNLQTLKLYSNQLAVLPAEIGQLTKLQTLQLYNNQLTALPAEIGQLTKLQTLNLTNNPLAVLPAEIGQLRNLQTLELANNRLTALPAEIGQLTKLQTLDLYNNQLAALPAEIGQLSNLQTLDLYNNPLAALPAEIGQLANLQALTLTNNQLSALPAEIGQLTNLRRLWLNNNQLTTVPRVLLDLPAGTEINLQGNPLPEAEIRAVRTEINRRRARGQAVPQLILPAIAADGEDALQVAAEGGMNVHQQPLTDAFKRRLDELANQFPDHLKGDIEQQRAEMKTIETRLFAAFERLAKHHPHYRAACDVARAMFEKGYGQRAAYFNDFSYSSGHVLSYVVLAMEAQWERTPDAQRDQARENGVSNLIDFLAAGSTFCDTRHIEEVLQMIGIPLSQHAQVNPDTIGATPVGLSAEQIRDTTLPVAKRTLRDIAQQTPGLADDALQEAFRTELTRAMHAEHLEVTQEQINAYLDTDILPMWGTFKEVALN